MSSQQKHRSTQPASLSEISQQKPRRKKRPRDNRDDEPPPAFFDATGTVSSTQFGAQRLPEIKALLLKSVAEDGTGKAGTAAAAALASTNALAFVSGGRKTSNRHLRRRATSHKPWKRRRKQYPTTTSSILLDEEKDTTQAPPKSRKVRRQRTHCLQREHESWRRPQQSCTTNSTSSTTLDDDLPAETMEASKEHQDSSNSKSTNNINSSGTATTTFLHWMTTHVWHAKRFRTRGLWGWSVPVLHSGRGCDAALRLQQQGKCLIQDVTWRSQPVWFRVPAAGTKASFAQQMTRFIPDFTLEDAAKNEHEMSGAFSGEGMLHQPDSFPQAAVGPVTWIATRRQLLQPTSSRTTCQNETKTKEGALFVYLFLHPSIRPVALSLFGKGEVFSSKKEIQGPIDGVEGGFACFQLRGKRAAACLEKVLTESMDRTDPTLTAFLEKRSVAKMHQHGSLFVSMSNAECTLPFCIRRVCLRDDTTSPNGNNNSACGFDLLVCPGGIPNDAHEELVILPAKTIFHNLILAGACPIGLTEEAALQLECDPPLPVFPRDYPDTAEGTKYWNSSHSKINSDSGGSIAEWMYVRKHWEGGGGRIRIICEEPVPDSVNWTEVISSDANKDNGEDASEPSVVVVRDAFVDPFFSALAGVGNLPPSGASSRDNDSAMTTRRRNRRPVTSSFCVAAQPRTNGDFAAHQEVCRSLSSALTMPAVLLCHVQVLGKGALKPGARLYAFCRPVSPVDDKEKEAATMTTPPLLGLITAGAFSVARGRSHGMAVVGAARFLQAVAAPQSDGAYLMVRRLDGSGRELQLKVRVQPRHKDSTMVEATLGLLCCRKQTWSGIDLTFN